MMYVITHVRTCSRHDASDETDRRATRGDRPYTRMIRSAVFVLPELLYNGVMFRIVTGIVVMLFGVGLIYVGTGEEWPVLIYGMVAVGVGIAIMLNKNEDTIEEITHNDDAE